MTEHVRLANSIIDFIGGLGIHVEVYRYVGSDDCELVAVDLETSEQWRVEGDDLYEAACVLAEFVGVQLEE